MKYQRLILVTLNGPKKVLKPFVVVPQTVLPLFFSKDITYLAEAQTMEQSKSGTYESLSHFVVKLTKRCPTLARQAILQLTAIPALYLIPKRDFLLIAQIITFTATHHLRIEYCIDLLVTKSIIIPKLQF